MDITAFYGCNNFVVPEGGAKNLVVFGEKTMLWHQRLGHIREKGFRKLHGNGKSNWFMDFDFCENYVYGKKNQVSFPSGAKKVKEILKLVHSDMFGLVSDPSLGKSV